MSKTIAFLAPLALLAACSTAPPGCPNVDAVPTSSIWDDGQSTFMQFPGNQRIPSVFTINPDGNPATVPYSVSGDTITIHQIAREFRLRDGDAVACVYNNAYDSVGTNYGTGTVSPNVARVPR